MVYCIIYGLPWYISYIPQFKAFMLPMQSYIPYILKFSRTKIFVDFVVFQAPTKILSLKISYKLANPTNLYRMRFAMVHLCTEHTVNE